MRKRRGLFILLPIIFGGILVASSYYYEKRRSAYLLHYLKVSEMLKKYPRLKPYADALRKFGFPWRDVELRDWTEIERELAPTPYVMGISTSEWVAFRYTPPAPLTLLHELIHTLEHPQDIAYISSSFIKKWTEDPRLRELIKPFDIPSLFAMELKELERRLGMSINEAARVMGWMPTWKRPGAPEYPDWMKVRSFAIELLAGLEFYDPICLDYLRKIVI